MSTYAFITKGSLLLVIGWQGPFDRQQARVRPAIAWRDFFAKTDQFAVDGNSDESETVITAAAAKGNVRYIYGDSEESKL